MLVVLARQGVHGRHRAGDGTYDGDRGLWRGGRRRLSVFVRHIDRDGREDSQVEPLLSFTGGVLVEPPRDTGQRQDTVEPAEEYRLIVASLGDECSRVSDLLRYLYLSRPDVIGGQNVEKIGIDELLLGVLEVLEPVLLLLGEHVAGCTLLVQVVPRDGSCLGDIRLSQLYVGLPDPFDRLLGLLDRHIRQVAVGPAGMSPEAEEVTVDSALAARVAKAHPAATAGAAQDTLQYVAVSPRAVALEATTGQDSLDSLPGGLVDERLMGSVKHNSLVDDLPGVIWIFQESVHLRVRQWCAAVLLRHPAA